MATQGLLFSEPTIAETGLWCELHEGINPDEWAELCRYLGLLTPKQFQKAQKRLKPNPNTLLNRLKRLFIFDQQDYQSLPLVKLGPLNL